MNRLTEAVLTCNHDLCFEQKFEKYQNFHLKIIIFTAVIYSSILHRHVCVMYECFIHAHCLRAGAVNPSYDFDVSRNPSPLCPFVVIIFLTDLVNY